uniref:Uncharacterized protein n=1 Tax=Cajanus cajan TaxID=3821 RepID=A0A151S4K9_CAJCA|nr:hypothetical protein KK1_028508 [Cajanus cajan]KYP49753.1 hypothetical protein KK1_028529 [Cajanus cajan]
MIQLLFTLIFLEAMMIALLLFKTPLRKLVIMGLDLLKRDRGPFMARTLNMFKIQKCEIEEGVAVNPTDQVLMADHILQATVSFVDFFSKFLI